MKELEPLYIKIERLTLRAKILQTIRDFFEENEFLEISTPLISTDLIPEAHIDPIVAETGFLLPSPEINMKQLLAAGYKRIFQIGPCFRKGEKGEHHLPEFTLLEWYRPGEDYHALTKDCEQLFLKIAKKLFQRVEIPQGQGRIDLTPPWPRITVRQAFLDYAGWDPIETINSSKFEHDLTEKVIPAMDTKKPLFLIDFPGYEASLARKNPLDARSAERLELFAGGLELANGFSELIDREEQRYRFEKANKKRRSLGKTDYPIPEKFLNCLSSMPPCAGIALGVDRLVMLFTGATHIEQVVALTP